MPKIPDDPADPDHLARLIERAENGAGLAHLRLGMPLYRPSTWCKDCRVRALCIERQDLGLWAPCEQPYENDLRVLEVVIDERNQAARSL
jgi:hypothetical protein